MTDNKKYVDDIVELANKISTNELVEVTGKLIDILKVRSREEKIAKRKRLEELDKMEKECEDEIEHPK